VALDAAPAHRERYPLILFSHGWEGCGTQSVFLTEQLARAGYVVAAPDHRDAGCSVDGRRPPRLHLPQLPFSTPGLWHESAYYDRREDLGKVLDWMLASPDFHESIDPARIGAMGHSLGGYSTLGMAGARESWQDSRITAVLALAP
jgi:predicted dienelactone hydrolase